LRFSDKAFLAVGRLFPETGYTIITEEVKGFRPESERDPEFVICGRVAVARQKTHQCSAIWLEGEALT
jgi:hypothetical protein